MIGQMGLAVVTAVDLVAVEISIVPETHGFRWRALLYKWRRTSSDNVSSMWFGALAECSSLLAEVTELIDQSGRETRSPGTQRSRQAGNQALRHSKMQVRTQMLRTRSASTSSRLGLPSSLVLQAGSETGQRQWALDSKVGGGKAKYGRCCWLAGWREEEGEMDFPRPKH